MRWKKRKLKSGNIDTGYEKGLVSVVLPVFNGEEYLKESIDSVLKQSYKDFELIIVNDGSTDSSQTIADEYSKKDKRVRVINQENEKLPSALNKGFSVARGEFYTWTSADNRMLTDFLEVMVKELKNNKKIDMVYGNQRLVDQKGQVIRGHRWFEFPVNSGNVIFPSTTKFFNIIPNNTIGAAFMYRAATDTVLKGYSKNLFLLEDYDYFMRMNSLFRIKHIKREKPVYEYRMHKNSLTAKDKELGITSFRQRLMEFESLRSKMYSQDIFVRFTDKMPFNEKELNREGIYIKEESQYCISVIKENIYKIGIKDREIEINNKKDAISFIKSYFIAEIIREKEEDFFN